MTIRLWTWLKTISGLVSLVAFMVLVYYFILLVLTVAWY